MERYHLAASTSQAHLQTDVLEEAKKSAKLGSAEGRVHDLPVSLMRFTYARH